MKAMAESRNDIEGFGLLGGFRAGFSSIARVLRRPSIPVFVWLAFLGLEAALVLPAWEATAAALDRNPLASGRDLSFLLDDLIRRVPSVVVELRASPLVAMLLSTFFAGGAVLDLGLRGRRPRVLQGFLADSGRAFPASFRCFLVFLLSILCWSWFVGLARGLLPEAARAGRDEAAAFAGNLAVMGIWLGGFGLLWILRRLALARMLLEDRRSALLSWFAALWLLLRRFPTILAGYSGLFLVWGIGVTITTLAVGRFLAGDRFLPALLVGQAGAILQKICLLASFVHAGNVWAVDRRARGEDSEPLVRVDPACPPEGGGSPVIQL